MASHAMFRKVFLPVTASAAVTVGFCGHEILHQLLQLVDSSAETVSVIYQHSKQYTQEMRENARITSYRSDVCQYCVLSFVKSSTVGCHVA